MDDTIIEATTSTKKFSTPRDAPKDYAVVNYTNHVRVYPSSPGVLSLQVRTEGPISDHGTKSWQCVSTAGMNLEAAETLHAALQIWIEEQHARSTDTLNGTG